MLIKQHFVSFGPKLFGQNLFVNLYQGPSGNFFSQQNFPLSLTEKEAQLYQLVQEKMHFVPLEEESFHFQAELQLGFLEAVMYGPLCQENIFGCIFILEKIQYLDEEFLKEVQGKTM